jgi:hypothetical protein
MSNLSEAAQRRLDAGNDGNSDNAIAFGPSLLPLMAHLRIASERPLRRLVGSDLAMKRAPTLDISIPSPS